MTMMAYRPHEQITEPEAPAALVPPPPVAIPPSPLPDAPSSPTDILGKVAMAQRLGISTRSVERGAQCGTLPKPTFIGDKPFWVWGDVVDHALKRKGKPRPKRPRSKAEKRPPPAQMTLSFAGE